MPNISRILLTVAIFATQSIVSFSQACNSTSNTKCGDECHCVDREQCGKAYCDGGCLGRWTNYHCQDECTNEQLQRATKCGEDCHCNSVPSCGADVCFGGCTGGWEGRTCQSGSCPDGNYGDRCQNNCNCPNRQSVACDKMTGACTGQCKPGYTGQDCQSVIEPCPDGKYGDRCQKKCNCPNRQSAACEKTTGACTEKCSHGYTEQNCQSATEPSSTITAVCPDGKYGASCDGNCDCPNRVTNNCDRLSGACLSPCNAGYRGQDCQTGDVNTGYLTAVVVLSILCVIFLICFIMATLKWRWLQGRFREEIQARYVTCKVKTASAEQNGVYEEIERTSGLEKTGAYENVVTLPDQGQSNKALINVLDTDI